MMVCLWSVCEGVFLRAIVAPQALWIASIDELLRSLCMAGDGAMKLVLSTICNVTNELAARNSPLTPDY